MLSAPRHFWTAPRAGLIWARPPPTIRGTLNLRTPPRRLARLFIAWCGRDKEFAQFRPLHLRLGPFSHNPDFEDHRDATGDWTGRCSGLDRVSNRALA